MPRGAEVREPQELSRERQRPRRQYEHGEQGGYSRHGDVQQRKRVRQRFGGLGEGVHHAVEVFTAENRAYSPQERGEERHSAERAGIGERAEYHLRKARSYRNGAYFGEKRQIFAFPQIKRHISADGENDHLFRAEYPHNERALGGHADYAVERYYA